MYAVQQEINTKAQHIRDLSSCFELFGDCQGNKDQSCQLSRSDVSVINQQEQICTRSIDTSLYDICDLVSVARYLI